MRKETRKENSLVSLLGSTINPYDVKRIVAKDKTIPDIYKCVL